MHSYLTSISGITLLSLVLTSGARSADADSPEKRLRDSLRAMSLQLRTSETEKAALQATQTENEEKIKGLTTEVDALKKKAVAQAKEEAASKEKADKAIAELDAKVADGDMQITRYKEALEKWKAGYKQAADLAAAKESERVKLTEQVGVLQGRVNYETAKNEALFKAGNEILTRYEKWSLGAALAAREPFTGIMRVKLQNIAQEYGDKLQDGKIKPHEEKRAVEQKKAAASEHKSTEKPVKEKEAPAKPAPAPALAEPAALDSKAKS